MNIETGLYIVIIRQTKTIAKYCGNRTWRIVASSRKYFDTEVQVIKGIDLSEPEQNTELSEITDNKALHIADVVRSLLDLKSLKEKESDLKKVTVEINVDTLKIFSDLLTKTALNKDDKIDWFKFERLTMLNLDLTLKYYNEL